MKTAKRILSWVIASTSVLFLLYFSVTIAYAAQTSGTCGKSLSWELSNGTLLISGSGAMADYSTSSAPWYSSRAAITSVVIGDNVTSIGNYAFEDCDKLTSLSIPPSVSSYGMYSFKGCSGLTAFSFSDEATYLGNMPLSCCANIASVSLPMEWASSRTSWSFGCLWGYTSYDGGVCLKQNVSQTGYNNNYMPKTLTEVIVTNGSKIPSYTFYNCSLLTSVVLPDTLTEIESYSFYQCSSLKTIVIPANVTEIDSHAFSSSGLENIIFLGDAPAFAENALPANVQITYSCNTSGWDTVAYSNKAVQHDLVEHEGKDETLTEYGWIKYDTCNRCDFSSYCVTNPDIVAHVDCRGLVLDISSQVSVDNILICGYDGNGKYLNSVLRSIKCCEDIFIPLDWIDSVDSLKIFVCDNEFTPIAKEITIDKCEINTNHNYCEASCTQVSICKTCGKSIGGLKEHSYIPADCTHPKMCSVCGYAEGDALGHILTDATCTTAAYCSRCNQFIGNPLGHRYTLYDDSVPCLLEYKCTRCDNIISVEDMSKHHISSPDLICDYCGRPAYNIIEYNNVELAKASSAVEKDKIKVYKSAAPVYSTTNGKLNITYTYTAKVIAAQKAPQYVSMTYYIRILKRIDCGNGIYLYEVVDYKKSSIYGSVGSSVTQTYTFANLEPGYYIINYGLNPN